MKYVLLSIKKKYADLIFSGNKTIEIRMTQPSEMPVRVFMYEAIGEGEGRGKIVGEFTANNISNYTVVNEFSSIEDRYSISQSDLSASCLTIAEIDAYVRTRQFYGWHISDLCKYTYPKTLADFELKRPPMSWQYIPKATVKRNDL